MSQPKPNLPKPILVVEDDHDVREALTDVLAEAGYDVLVARDGQEALEVLERSAPSLILLDLMMPRMNGYQFRERQVVEPRLAQIPVVILSADRQIEVKARELEAEAWISKPVDLDRLLDTVERFGA